MWIVQKGKTREKKRKKGGGGVEKIKETKKAMGGCPVGGDNESVREESLKERGWPLPPLFLSFFFLSFFNDRPRFLSAGLTSTPSPVTAFNPRWKDVYLPTNEIFFPLSSPPPPSKGSRFGRVKQPAGVIWT